MHWRSAFILLASLFYCYASFNRAYWPEATYGRSAGLQFSGDQHSALQWSLQMIVKRFLRAHVGESPTIAKAASSTSAFPSPVAEIRSYITNEFIDKQSCIKIAVSHSSGMAWHAGSVKRFSAPRQPPQTPPARRRYCRLPLPRSCRSRSNL